MSSIEHDAAEWQRLIGAQDDFVARILQEKANFEGVLKAPVVPPADATDATLVALTQVESLKVYALSLQEQIRAQDQKHAEELEGARYGRPTRSTPNRSVVASTEGTTRAAPPFILVLIDGSCAPWTDGLVGQGKTGGLQAAQQVQWEVEKELRANALDLEEGSSDQVEVITYCFYNKFALVKSLIEAGVISSGATWEEFTLAFNSSPLSNLIDIGHTPVDIKMGGILSLLGPLPSLKRVYLVGVHPASLIASQPASDRSLAPKLVTINHRETEEDRTELERFGWRVASFTRLFSSTSGLVAFAANGIDEEADTRSSTSDSASKVLWRDSYAKDSWKAVGSGTPSTATNGVTNGKRSTKEPPKFNPNKAFLAQDPQICVFHYCSPTGCTQRKCERSHYYELSPAQLVRLKQDVARSPCKEMRKNGTCQWKATNGTNCMYNHALGTKPTRAGKWAPE